MSRAARARFHTTRTQPDVRQRLPLRRTGAAPTRRPEDVSLPVSRRYRAPGYTRHRVDGRSRVKNKLRGPDILGPDLQASVPQAPDCFAPSRHRCALSGIVRDILAGPRTEPQASMSTGALPNGAWPAPAWASEPACPHHPPDARRVRLKHAVAVKAGQPSAVAGGFIHRLYRDRDSGQRGQGRLAVNPRGGCGREDLRRRQAEIEDLRMRPRSRARSAICAAALGVAVSSLLEVPARTAKGSRTYVPPRASPRLSSPAKAWIGQKAVRAPAELGQRPLSDTGITQIASVTGASPPGSARPAPGNVAQFREPRRGHPGE